MQHQFVSDLVLRECAVHQANTALRLGREHDRYGRNAAINRMYDTLERCRYPYTAAGHLIRQVGEKKALVLGLSRPLIDLALKMDS